MLVEFSVENFRSFRDKATLSLLASSDKSLNGNVTKCIALKGEYIVNSAAIYGPNASGKSNLIIAMALLRNFVVNSHTHQKGQKLNFQPFAFDHAWNDRPTTFSISFVQREILYDYKLSINRDRIVGESLFHYPNGKRAMIFSRDVEGFVFTNGKKEQELISKRTLENALYLSTSVQFNYEGTTAAYEWFSDRLTVLETTDLERSIETMIGKMNSSKKFKEMVLGSLQAADLGIVGLEGDVRKIPVQDLHGKVAPQIIGMMTLTGNESVITTDLRFSHMVKDEKGVEKTIDLHYLLESEGTRRLFAIIGPVLEALVTGGTLCIDELDTKLHHKISGWLIDLFHDPEQNEKGAQLIFNTHDLLLLDQERFRRDQIWFTEKNADAGSSSLYSLAEFGERKDKDILKAYLLGRYGATPFVAQNKVF